MSQDLWNYLFIGLSFVLYIGIAVRSRAASTSDYYTAGGGVSPFANGMATAADWMSAATFISMAGLISATGYEGSRFLMGWTGGFVLLTVLMVPFLRKFGKATVPDFVGDRYYSKVARAVAVVCAIFICMTYIMGQMRFTAGDEPVAFLDKLNNLNKDLGFQEYTAKSDNMTTINMFCITAALMCGTAGLPHVIVRFFTVKNVRAVRTSACWTLLFISVIYLTAPTIGAFSRVNLIEKLNGTAFADVPAWFRDFEQTKQMVWVDKNNDGIINYYGPKDSSAGTSSPFLGNVPEFPPVDSPKEQLYGSHGERLLVNKADRTNRNELWFHKDIMVMANPHMAGLPQWVIALLMAGCIAAALSTAAGLLLVLSTSISHDLVKGIVNPGISDKEEVRYARIASFTALAVASYFGINPPGDFIAQTVAFAFGLAASSFFPTLLMGIFSKRMNKYGAVSGMAAGITFTFFYIIYFRFLGGSSADYLWGISPEGIGCIGMLVNFAVAFVVSFFTPAPPQEVQRMVESIRLPDTPGDEASSSAPPMH